ncbi:hypothetical protein RF11_16332 [Thelohanellus kitauei]|uniref:Uncharacterized protein n=1 Tax=Thelohanellus kitauei TaxID=669202 RepID=A0A0C2I5X6_THEKT|nr:hypothetical protein RF11_16332 [Thelohanellus kitauei]
MEIKVEELKDAPLACLKASIFSIVFTCSLPIKAVATFSTQARHGFLERKQGEGYEIRHFAIELIKLYEVGYGDKNEEILIPMFTSGLIDFHLIKELMKKSFNEFWCCVEEAESIDSDDIMSASNHDVCLALKSRNVS